MKLVKSSEVPGLIKDGDFVALTGLSLAGLAENAFVEIEKSFLETGHPRDLTLFWQAGVGRSDMPHRGLGHMCHEGLFTKAIGGHLNGCGPVMAQFSKDNKAAIYNWPQGVCMNMFSAIASHKPGVITKIGLKTFIDPRFGAGKMNSKCDEILTQVITLNGEEWLFYPAPKKVNVTIIRGTTADEKGNITMEHEAMKLGQLAAAEAAKATGGIVICQVERIVKAGSLNPKLVAVPGILVDYCFVSDPNYHWMTAGSQFDAVLNNEYRVSLSSVQAAPLNERKVISRRAAMEIKSGNIVNLGVGTPEGVSLVFNESGLSDEITLTSEGGSIGGVPSKGHDFGCSYNAEAIIESTSIFDMYDGGTLDVGCLGFLEIAPNGDLNASSRNGLGIGVGGFMNIAGGASKVLFLGTFMGGTSKESTPKYEVKDGTIKILREGNSKKFINKIGQVSFSGEVAMDLGKEIYYITERCVFKLSKEGLVLIEIAPGIDLQKDILDLMEFTPIVSKELKLMDSNIFYEEWDGLKDYVNK